MSREKGFALVTTLLFVMVFMALGFGAMMMSYYGYLTQDSENNYQRAGWAAEYAINQAMSVLPTCSATATSCPTLSVSGASCNYTGIVDSGNTFCMIRGVGQFRNARVVKSVVVPLSTSSNWSALVTRTGTLNLGGSASISNCDTNCPAGGPAVVYQTSLNGSYATHDSTPANCPNNPKGIYGHPPVQQKSNLPNDLAPTFFGTATDWNSVVSGLGSKYGVDAANLTAGSIPSACQVTWVSPCGGKKQPACPTLPPSGCTGGKVYIDAAGYTVSLGAVSNLTVVSNGTVSLTDALSAVNIFANAINVSSSTDIAGGGTFYTQGNITLDMGNNQVLGSVDSPLLMIQAGNFLASGNGGPDLYGMIYTKGTTVSISGNGNLKIRGSIIHDNPSATFDTSSGNLGLEYNYAVLTNLSNNLGGFIKRPSCGGSTKDYVLTKQTAY